MRSVGNRLAFGLVGLAMLVFSGRLVTTRQLDGSADHTERAEAYDFFFGVLLPPAGMMIGIVMLAIVVVGLPPSRVASGLVVERHEYLLPKKRCTIVVTNGRRRSGEIALTEEQFERCQLGDTYDAEQISATKPPTKEG